MSSGQNNTDPTVRVRGLTRSYREGDSVHTVIRDAKLQILPGECVALLGRSGSGKSTLLNLISGIDLPSGGEVRIGGQNLTGMTEQQRTLFRRDHIGFVFQFYNLIPTLNVMENLLLPLELKKSLDADSQRRALDILQQVGLEDRSASYPDRLSGGEQQRVAICRALLHNPLVLLADEPTGNLDRSTAESVTGVLQTLQRENGAILICVTHSDALAAAMDQRHELVDGRLIAS